MTISYRAIKHMAVRLWDSALMSLITASCIYSSIPWDKFHQDIGNADRVVLVDLVGEYPWHWEFGSGSD
jgi:hypothetical protein